MAPISDITKQTNINVENTGVSTFKNIFADLVNNVNETDAVAKQDIIKIAEGSADDLHTITINSEKAELATLMLIQVRNKVLDAYNEIMRITL
jgi:flagellar hook-basal body complex protein FliE